MSFLKSLGCKCDEMKYSRMRIQHCGQKIYFSVLGPARGTKGGSFLAVDGRDPHLIPTSGSSLSLFLHILKDNRSLWAPQWLAAAESSTNLKSRNVLAKEKCIKDIFNHIKSCLSITGTPLTSGNASGNNDLGVPFILFSTEIKNKQKTTAKTLPQINGTVTNI